MSVAPENGRAEVPAEVDVVIVGAGFAGLHLLYLMRKHGFCAVALEAGEGVGGTWYWNRYPGARCDIESMEYSYQFDKELEQEWAWSERYAPQPEILAYANHVADKHDLRRDICFGRRVRSATYDEAGRRWTLTTEKGEAVAAPFCIMATGCLSAPNETRFDGEEDFPGPIYRTSLWPHQGVDFTGQRVAVIGTGSSAIQSIPEIAKQVAALTVFQRTPNYAVPAWNHALEPDYVARVKADYAGLRARQRKAFSAAAFRFNPDAVATKTPPDERQAEYERRWAEGGLGFLAAYTDLLFDPQANITAADFVRAKIREIVDDPEVAELLCPSNTIGCKRLCVDTDYYKTYNLPHVRLVDVSETPIRIAGDSVMAGDEAFPADAIVLAIGFDAMTGALMRIDIQGRAGRRLAQKWAEGPVSFMGLAVEGFPNLFTVTGPGSPSVFTNMLPSIEQHCEWITECLCHLRDAGENEIEVRTDAEADWQAHHQEVGGAHLRSGCASWYTGENIEGKPAVFMPYIGGFPRYVQACEAVTAGGYAEFVRR